MFDTCTYKSMSKRLLKFLINYKKFTGKSLRVANIVKQGEVNYITHLFRFMIRFL